MAINLGNKKSQFANRYNVMVPVTVHVPVTNVSGRSHAHAMKRAKTSLREEGLKRMLLEVNQNGQVILKSRSRCRSR